MRVLQLKYFLLRHAIDLRRLAFTQGPNNRTCGAIIGTRYASPDECCRQTRSNDVKVDERGLIIVVGRHVGFDVLDLVAIAGEP